MTEYKKTTYPTLAERKRFQEMEKQERDILFKKMTPEERSNILGFGSEDKPGYCDANGHCYSFEEDAECADLYIKETEKLKEENKMVKIQRDGGRETRKRLDFAIKKLKEENEKLKEDVFLNRAIKEVARLKEELKEKEETFKYQSDMEKQCHNDDIDKKQQVIDELKEEIDEFKENKEDIKQYTSLVKVICDTHGWGDFIKDLPEHAIKTLREGGWDEDDLVFDDESDEDILDYEELKEEVKKLKEEVKEDNECESLIMEIWANGGDRDDALPIHYRQKKKNGEWGVDDE